jgi:hypothetical protein
MFYKNLVLVFYLVFVDFSIVGNAVLCNCADGQAEEDAGNSGESFHFLENSNAFPKISDLL